MKVRRSILLFVASVTVAIVLLLRFEQRKPPGLLQTLPARANALPLTTSTSNLPATHAPIRTSVIPVATAPSISAPTSNSTIGSKEQTMAQILSIANDVPIDFYGEVEDQYGNSVPASTVHFEVRVINGSVSTVKRGQVDSDQNGFFTITGYRGQDLSMRPEKAGYALATSETVFSYSHLDEHYYVPDAHAPTVIKMWKLHGAEPLVNFDWEYKLQANNSPIIFDLLTGKIVPSGGDIQITLQRPSGVVSIRNRQDWGLQVQAVEGGLIETSMTEARVTYAAPDSGYQADANFAFSTNAPSKWSGGFDQMFFISSRKGLIYSKVFLSVNINRNPDDPLSLSFRGVANANGSRNWEDDANTMK